MNGFLRETKGVLRGPVAYLTKVFIAQKRRIYSPAEEHKLLKRSKIKDILITGPHTATRTWPCLRYYGWETTYSTTLLLVPMSHLVISIYTDLLRNVWAARNLQQTPTWSKLLPPVYGHRTPVYLSRNASLVPCFESCVLSVLSLSLLSAQIFLMSIELINLLSTRYKQCTCCDRLEIFTWKPVTSFYKGF